jgi:hypothetical protein
MSGLNGDQFSLKARRTTRIPLRIPIQIVLHEDGKPVTLDAWTTIVNIHGARIECKRGLVLQQEVLIQVPFNGMSQKGSVVWNRKEQNERGNFEFAVELERPENLWGVGFPPSDWDSVKANGAGSSAAPKAEEKNLAAPTMRLDPPISAAPVTDPPAPATVQPSETSPPEPVSVKPVPAPAFDIAQSDPSLVDLSVEISSAATGEPAPSSDTPSEPAVAIPTFEESIEMLITAQLAEPTAVAPPLPETNLCSNAPEVSQPQQEHAPMPLRTESALTPAPVSLGNTSPNPTDKLSAFFQELVETALRDRVMGVVQRISERMESRVQQIEADAISRVEQRVQSAANAMGEAMERRTLDFVGSQQVAVEQSVQEFLKAAETDARRQQQEFLDQNRQALRDEMTGLMESSKTRLEQQAADLASVTQQALRFSMEQQLPGIEKDLLERCRAEAERMMAGQVEQWTLLLKDRAQEAQRTIVEDMERTAADARQRYATALDASTDQTLEQAGARLEQQLARIGTQVRQTFLRHIIGELSRSQQIWIQQAQRQMETVAAQNLQWTRQSVSQIMKNFGESLIRQAYLEGGTPPEVAPVAAASRDHADAEADHAETGPADPSAWATGQHEETPPAEHPAEAMHTNSV